MRRRLRSRTFTQRGRAGQLGRRRASGRLTQRIRTRTLPEVVAERLPCGGSFRPCFFLATFLADSPPAARPPAASELLSPEALSLDTLPPVGVLVELSLVVGVVDIVAVVEVNVVSVASFSADVSFGGVLPGVLFGVASRDACAAAGGEAETGEELSVRSAASAISTRARQALGHAPSSAIHQPQLGQSFRSF